jgi:hypothetical protein
MRGLSGATLADIDAVGSLILNTTARGVAGMGCDRGPCQLPTAFRMLPKCSSATLRSAMLPPTEQPDGAQHDPRQGT